MITGVWISPDTRAVAVQWDEDSITYSSDTVYAIDIDEVPADWRTLYVADGVNDE